MAQHDYNIANQTFPNTRSDINNALSAVASNNSGTTPPSTTFSNQWFYETDTNLLQIRNEDNDAYITIAELDQTNDTVEYFKADSIRTALIEFTDGDDAITIADGGVVTISATGTAVTVGGIPFYRADNSIYTHDVSGTDSTAEFNTAYGVNALDAITTGDKNIAIGYNAGSAVTEAVGNVLIGEAAGASITTGGSNTLIGRLVGDGFDTEANNLAIGVAALGGSIAGGEYNVAVGNYALDALTSGDGNTALGYNAGTALTTGNYNVAVGYESQALGVISGEHNICFGYRSGYDLTSGSNNVFAGLQAGFESTTGSSNVGIGAYAGNKIVGDGNFNTLLGYAAGFEITTGDNNSCLGKDSGRTGSPGGSLVTTNNNICLGDNNINALHCQASLTVASDERDKTDFTALDVGLDFVNDLKPYTYKWDKRIKYVSDADRDTVDLDTVTHDGTHKEDWLDIGFKAQEIEVLEKAAGYKITDKTNLVTSLSNDGKQYGIRYEKFVPILVKAIQELSAKVKALEEA